MQGPPYICLFFFCYVECEKLSYLGVSDTRRHLRVCLPGLSAYSYLTTRDSKEERRLERQRLMQLHSAINAVM